MGRYSHRLPLSALLCVVPFFSSFCLHHYHTFALDGALLLSDENNNYNVDERSPDITSSTSTNHRHPNRITSRQAQATCDINNQNIPITSCISWQAFSSGISTFDSRVVIPCGTCVIFINDGINLFNLTFYDGIDIQGQLIIDSCNMGGTNRRLDVTFVSMYTTLLLIQGKLQIDATCKAIDGVPLISITTFSNTTIMNGQQQEQSSYYTPIHDEIKLFCFGASIAQPQPCNAGEKSITVAGGIVDLDGIPPFTPTWLNLYDVSTFNNVLNPTGIVVDAIIKNKWNVGATIIITSFTTHWNKYQQVRTIKQINDYSAQHVELVLNEPFIRPITLLDDPNYAVEVALLSRNIVFNSIVSNSTVGGHFWVFHTANTAQKIQGIDVRNFGQQGRLGRYPIHLHHCKNSSGSIISKNTIRQSFQRCVVVHGTNNVNVIDNVAYDTAGHCFMIEDGIETNNEFNHNIGIMTRKPTIIIPPHIFMNNGKESDGTPSTFWITNPSNRFINNVAAGSEDSGYWIEPMKRGMYANDYPHLDPPTDPLDSFQNNVAHSCAEKGFRTYPLGYFPRITANFKNIKAYRNNRTGIFLHISSNILIEESKFADNGLSIDLERTLSPAIQLKNIEITGLTDAFRGLVVNKNLDSVCATQFDAYEHNVGIEMRTWKNEVGTTGSTWNSVKFYKFNHGTCPYSQPISLDYTIRNGSLMFDYYSSIQNLTFDNVVGSPIDFCRAASKQIKDIYLTDLDGSLRPQGLTFVRSPSTLVSTDPNMLKFVNQTKCTDVPTKCHSYCQDTCFRGILYEVDPSQTAEYELKICDKSDPNNCIVTPGFRRAEDPYYSHRYRHFPAYLPIGEYNAVFIESTTGKEVWPSFARELNADTLCPSTAIHAVTLTEPRPDYQTCVELIRNGNAEASSTQPSYWLTQGRGLGDIQLLPLAGVGGSNALASVKNDTRTILIQYLDTRCLKLMKNAEYIVYAEVKLIRNGMTYACNPLTERCPEIGIYTEEDGFMDTSDYDEDERQHSDLFVGLALRKFFFDPALEGMNPGFEYDFGGSYNVLAKMSSNVTSLNGFQTIEGKFRFTDDIINKQGVRFYVQSFNDQLIVDNVSMRLANATATTTTTTTCINLIANSDMELGNDGHWTGGNFGTINTTSPGYYSSMALRYSKKGFFQTGPSYIANVSDFIKCFQNSAATQLTISTQVKIVRRKTNAGAACLINKSCPAIRIEIINQAGLPVISSTTRSYMSRTWNPNDFNAFQTSIPLPPPGSWMSDISRVSIGFASFTPLWDLIWDDFYVRLI